MSVLVEAEEKEQLEHNRVMENITALKPKESIIYHKGFLAPEAEGEFGLEARILARGRRSGAMLAYEVGLCLLTQRKMMDGWYEYIATRKKR